MKLIPNSMTRKFAITVLKTKKQSPHIFFVAGVAGVVGAGVLACKATLKLDKTLDEAKHDVQDVKDLYSDSTKEREYYKDLGAVYFKHSLKLARLYGPAIAVGSVSVASLTGSHVQLTKRNTALTATVAGLAKAYDDYRERVAAELGEDREKQIHAGVTEETHTIDGKKQTVEKFSEGHSNYARFFDDFSPYWQKDPELNRIFLNCQLNYFNYQLQARGHVFLNEVYDALGLERSQAGSVVGWVLDGDGDGYIDFGIFDLQNASFVNNVERSILLDFNVDGVIYDLIKEGKF